MSVWGKRRELDAVEVNGRRPNGGLALTDDSHPNGVLAPEAVMDEQLLARYDKPRSHVASGCALSGTLSFDGSVRIDARVSGEVSCPDTLIIGPRAFVDATVRAAVVVVVGRTGGEIRATERVEMLSGSRVEGTVVTPVFEAESGCLFSGKIKLSACELLPAGDEPVKD